MDLLLLFNVCGIRGQEKADQYVRSIRSFLNQKECSFRVIVSGCLSTPQTKELLQREFGKEISYCWTEAKVPVNVTFNAATLQGIKQFGPQTGYMFLDCGIEFQDEQSLAKLLDLHRTGNYGITAARTDHDLGSILWFGWRPDPEKPEPEGESLFKDGHLVIPIGKTVNLHAQIFDHSIVEAFGRPCPDIFASQCTESIFSFLCAAVRKRFVVHRDVMVKHHPSMDGASSGFWPPPEGHGGWNHVLPESWRSIEAIIADPEARESGMGYEEVQAKLLHNPGAYNGDGQCHDPERLRDFLADNFYLMKSRFSYRRLPVAFIP